MRDAPSVQDVARRTGHGFDSVVEEDKVESPGSADASPPIDGSKMRKAVRKFMNELMVSFAPSPYWAPPLDSLSKQG